MTIKQSAIHSLVSAVLASIACLIYNKIYSDAYYVDFSKVMSPFGIIASCLIGCLLMGAAYFLVFKWKGTKWIGWLNLLISILSFASIIGVIGMLLPLDIESPEMFPGLAIPMHFFPALAFFATIPFFDQK
jgi:hypothetical protein